MNNPHIPSHFTYFGYQFRSDIWEKIRYPYSSHPVDKFTITCTNLPLVLDLIFRRHMGRYLREMAIAQMLYGDHTSDQYRMQEQLAKNSMIRAVFFEQMACQQMHHHAFEWPVNVIDINFVLPESNDEETRKRFEVIKRFD